MANSDYIKEFLVKLGYEVNESDRKKFEDSLQKSDKSTASLAKNLKELAVALGTASTIAAYRLNSLYVNSQRIGTSAAKLNAYSQAVSNVGGDAAAAVSSVGALAQKLRDIPNFPNVFKRFGVEAKDSNGQIRDTIDLLTELVNSSKFRSQSYAQQSAYMKQTFGIDDLTFRSIRSGEFAKEYQKFLDIQKKLGNETNNSAKAVRDLTKGFNEFRYKGGAVLDVLVGNLADKLVPALQAVNEKFDDLLDWYSQLSPESKELAKNIGSIAVGVSALATALGALKVFRGLLGSIFGGAAAGGGGAAGTAAAGGSLLANPVTLLGAAAAGSFAANASQVLKNSDWQVNAENGGDLVGALYGDGRGPQTHATASAGLATVLGTGSGTGGNGGKGKLGLSEIVSFFTGKGLTKEQASGIAANLWKESKFDPRAVGDKGKAVGMAQWHPDRQALFKKWFSKDIRQSTGREQLEFIFKELQTTERGALQRLLKAKTAMEAGGVFSRYYERPLRKDQEAFERGRIGEQFNQTVNITINGATDSKKTANDVTGAMRDQYSTMERNFRNPAR